jgi:hypothetical protein
MRAPNEGWLRYFGAASGIFCDSSIRFAIHRPGLQAADRLDIVCEHRAASLCFFRAAVIHFSSVGDAFAEIGPLVLRAPLCAACSGVSSLARGKCLVG